MKLDWAFDLGTRQFAASCKMWLCGIRIKHTNVIHKISNLKKQTQNQTVCPRWCFCFSFRQKSKKKNRIFFKLTKRQKKAVPFCVNALRMILSHKAKCRQFFLFHLIFPVNRLQLLKSTDYAQILHLCRLLLLSP